MFGEIRNARGERIEYTVHPGKKDSERVVVLGHGVTGNKDRPFLVAMGEALGSAGIPAMRFSFSGNGQSGGAFADSALLKEVDDLGAVLDALGSKAVCYAGHSMGAAVGALRASRDRRIQWLISLAGMVYTRDFAEREFGTVKPGEGFMWDEPACPLSRAYMDDMARVESTLDAAAQISVPWLFIHGTEDDVVPLKDSRDACARTLAPKELAEIPGANHVFAGDQTPIMIERVIEWLRRQGF